MKSACLFFKKKKVYPSLHNGKALECGQPFANQAYLIYNKIMDMETRFDFAVKKKRKLKEPNDYKVVLYNDNFTTMDFVVDVLVDIFNKSTEKAEAIMLDIHKNGRGIAGIYTKDIALTKAKEVILMARQNEFPLKCTIEKV
ncbi:MAG: hypothetical protein Ta2G_13140 [Termitinemataceae bacterium]|nr:MAG: hypothetical protein Ta2G_13140 [Termitinemataceae bacterium]